MDYTSLLETLSKAPLFDLWRLKAAIARALEDPRKNEAIRAALHKVRRDLLRVGDTVGFRNRSNREVYGVVTKLNPKTASVRLTTAEQWRVHYGFLFHVLDAQADPTQQAPQHQIKNTASGSEVPE